jgi:uncharacterized protein
MEIINFTPIPALLGGLIIGLASSMFLVGIGKVFGISAIISGILKIGQTLNEKYWRVLVLLGLIFGAFFGHWIFNTATINNFRSYPYLVVGPLIMAFGACYGSGCTSGHCVCGISRFSKRSIVATINFLFTGGLTVLLMRILGLN